jgi:ketosteroid isomerase-like protein
MNGRTIGSFLIFFAALAAAMISAALPPAHSGIDEFNRALTDATARMDNAAALALWEDNGISLLPLTKPIVGKPALSKFYDEVTTQLSGARMEKFEMHCFDIETEKDWATEWCSEHQHVILPGDKPAFDGAGKMLLVLHRGSDGKWRLRREMWNADTG